MTNPYGPCPASWHSPSVRLTHRITPLSHLFLSLSLPLLSSPLCYRSPLESYLDPLCLPYRSAPAHHTHRQTKSSISPGKRCRRGAAQPGAGLEGAAGVWKGEWGKTGLFYYSLKRLICWLRLSTMEGKIQGGWEGKQTQGYALCVPVRVCECCWNDTISAVGGSGFW